MSNSLSAGFLGEQVLLSVILIVSSGAHIDHFVEALNLDLVVLRRDVL